MTDRPSTPATVTGDELFGDVLRRLRIAAGLSQEALAERSGLSARAISDLERGARRAPYRDTVRMLADALELSVAGRAALAAAAPRHRAPAGSGSAPSNPAPAAIAPTGNLPAPLSSFVGREQEQAEVGRLLGRTRLLTLTGTGGIGKTRLALEAGSDLRWAYPDGVWLVELAALTDPALVPRAVAAAFAVHEQPGQSLLDTLVDALKPRHLLLVLDNCEHVIAACARLADTLLRGCPALRILATSRESLGLTGETLFQVPSLAVPEAQPPPPFDRVTRFAAVLLFVERARAVQPSFAVTADNARSVVEICRRLDGIPLALELAAARVRSLSVAAIATRLDARFRLLTGGSRTALPRQQTLRAALDWSYDLLSGPERTVLRRMAVFAGGFDPEAAEAVCTGDGIATDDPFDLLTQLVDKSLLLVEAPDGETRYRLLETVRQYAWEQLQAAAGPAGGEQAAVTSRHAAWYLAMAEQAAPALQGPDQAVWLRRLEREHDNLRAALAWSLAPTGEPTAGLQLGAALGRFWLVHGHVGGGREWLERLLSATGGDPVQTLTRARVLSLAGSFAHYQGDYTHAAARLEQSVASYRMLGDRQGTAAAIANLATVAQHLGDLPRAERLMEEGLASLQELGDLGSAAIVLNNLALVASDQGDYPRAIARQQESLALKRRLGNQHGVASSLLNLGEVALRQGDEERAAAWCQEALALARELSDERLTALAVLNLGAVALRRGDITAAGTLGRGALPSLERLGDRRTVAESLDHLGAVAAAHGDRGRAARLAGAAAALRTAIGAPVPPTQQTALDAQLARLRASLGDQAFAAAWAAGQAMPLEQAVAEALAEPEAG